MSIGKEIPFSVTQAAEDVIRQTPRFERERDRVARAMVKAAKGELRAPSNTAPPEGIGNSPAFDSYVDNHVVAKLSGVKARRRKRKRRRRKLSEGLVQSLSRHRADDSD